MTDELNPTASIETPEALAETSEAVPTPGTVEAQAEVIAEVETDAPMAESAPVEPPAHEAEQPVPVAAEETPTEAAVEVPAEVTEGAAAETNAEAAVEAAAETPDEVPAEAAVEMSDEAASEAQAPLATPKSMDELTAGMEIAGRVKRIELFGAFVDIGIGKDGLLHISQLGKADVRNVADVVQVGETLNVFVLKVDKEQGRIALSLTKPVGMPWDALRQGMEVTGTVIKLETYGVFVDFGAERPGMVHVSELASGYVKSPADVVKVGDVVTAQVIKLDKRKKRIDLSVKAMTEKEETVSRQELRDEPQEDLPTAMELALRRAMGNESGTFERNKRDKERDERRSRKFDRDRDDIYERTLRNHRG